MRVGLCNSLPSLGRRQPDPQPSLRLVTVAAICSARSHEVRELPGEAESFAHCYCHCRRG
jgi:hypothetical protein